MNNVVSDTSPLNYLIMVGCVEVLPMLFTRVFIPPAVAAELRDVEGQPAVIHWANHLPDWIDIVTPKTVHYQGLHKGESEAIALALELKFPVVLMDERLGRQRALEQGLQPVGVMRLLDEADACGLMDFDTSVTLLRKTNFRISQKVLDVISKRVHQRKGI